LHSIANDNKDFSSLTFSSLLFCNRFLHDEHGVDLTVRSALSGGALLGKASFHGYLEMVKYLYDKCPQMLNSQNFDGATALSLSCGFPDIARFLIGKGALLNKVTKRHATALLIACQQGQLESVKVLVEAGCDMNKQCDLGASPAWVAQFNGHPDVCNYLVAKGATVARPMPTFQLDGFPGMPVTDEDGVPCQMQ
jgi:ankyrin repeat protein